MVAAAQLHRNDRKERRIREKITDSGDGLDDTGGPIRKRSLLTGDGLSRPSQRLLTVPRGEEDDMRKKLKWMLVVNNVIQGLGLVVLTVALVALIPAVASAEEEGLGPELAQVRAVTARFHRIEEAIAAGYELGWVNGSGVRIITGCVSHPIAGAMGYHYFNAVLMADNGVDPLEPEVLVYAPAADGGLKLVAVEWVVLGPRSNPPGVPTPPSVLGMEMHILVPYPGPDFWIMHAWVWANNPAGMFEDWNPEVSCL